MRVRGKLILSVLTAAVVGVVGGGAVAYLVQPQASSAGVPSPIPGVQPTVPTVPAPRTYPQVADIDYPTLTVPTAYKQLTISNGAQAWSYPRPRTWTHISCATPTLETPLKDCSEVYFRPPLEPVVGGYSLRVQAIIGTHGGTAAAVATRLLQLRSAERDGNLAQLKVLRRTDSSLSIRYLYRLNDGSGYLLRYDDYAWFAAPGSNDATLTMSVTGREQDTDAMRGLLSDFTARLHAVG